MNLIIAETYSLYMKISSMAYYVQDNEQGFMYIQKLPQKNKYYVSRSMFLVAFVQSPDP